jgi:hypothetical protein
MPKNPLTMLPCTLMKTVSLTSMAITRKTSENNMDMPTKSGMRRSLIQIRPDMNAPDATDNPAAIYKPDRLNPRKNNIRGTSSAKKDVHLIGSFDMNV